VASASALAIRPAQLQVDAGTAELVDASDQRAARPGLQHALAVEDPQLAGVELEHHVLRQPGRVRIAGQRHRHRRRDAQQELGSIPSTRSNAARSGSSLKPAPRPAPAG
jgi:hypothetical protein